LMATLPLNRRPSGIGTCPFQYDTVIAFNEQSSIGDKVDDDSEDDSGDEDEDDDNMDDEAQTKHSPLGRIAANLEKGGLEYVSLSFNPEKASRTKEAYSDMEGKVKEESFPRNQRLCSVMDLRGPDDAENGIDNFFLFRPVDGADRVEQNPLSLNYFNNAKKSIIPNANDQKQDDHGDKAILNTATSGPQITLSFHVDTEDSIRCYFFLNGQCTRFQAQDIKLVLGRIFEIAGDDRQSQQNKAFLEGNDQINIMEIIEDVETKLKDDDFEKFLRLNKVTCPLKEEQEKKDKK